MISFLIISGVFFIITLDVLFIPTFVLTFLVLLTFFGYLSYVYFNISAAASVYLLLIFFVLGLIYTIIVFKFRLWERFSFKEKLAYTGGLEQENLNKKLGLTITDLKPIGIVLIEKRKRDAIAVNGFIAKNKRVEVIGFSGAQLQVRPHSNIKG